MENTKKKETLKSTLDKVVLTDAGIKNKYREKTLSSKDPKNKIYYPTIYLNSKEAPCLSGIEIGDEKTLALTVKMKSHSLNESEGAKTEDFTLEILKIGVIK
jgi:hypothetical protein